MKTIVIFSGYYLPHLGGIERYVSNLSNELLKLGYIPIIITSKYDDNLKDEEIINGIKIIRIPIYNFFKNRYPVPKNSKILFEKLNRYKIDRIIVNTRFHLTSLVGAIYGAKKKIPVYLIDHGSDHLTVDNIILDFFGSIYEHFLTEIIKKYIVHYYGVSQASAKWLTHFNIIPDGIWYNSINTNEVINKKLEKNVINITYAGRILKQKGLDSLLSAFIKVEKLYPNIKLNIIGDGNYLSYLKNKFSKENINFVGSINYEKLKEYYEKTDIFVYPPIWKEGFPSSILEAGFFKCAVIATNNGGNKEIINDRVNGILIKSNTNELIFALKTLIKNNKLRTKYANQLAKDVKNKFSWKETANKIVNDLSSLKILHVLATSRFSGAENVACQIIDINKKSGFTPFYCSPDGEIKLILKKKNINFIPIKTLGLKSLKRVCKKYKIDIIHAHDFQASFYVTNISFKGKIISQIHCSLTFMKTWNLFSLIYLNCTKKIYRIVVVSPTILEKTVLKEKISYKTIIINNVIDKNRIVKLSKEFVSENKYDLAFFGRLTKNKQPLFFLEIVKELKKFFPNIKTAIVGNGELKKTCVDFIKNHSLKDNVLLFGFLNNPFPIIKNSKIIIMPSLTEGLSLTSIESMCLKKPLINSGCDGLSILFEQNEEFICHTKNEYVKKIKNLLDNKKFYDNYKKSVQLIVQPYINFSKWKKMVSLIYE